MALDDSDVKGLNQALSSAQISGDTEPGAGPGGIQITCFSEVVNDVTLQFQIIRLPKQVIPVIIAGVFYPAKRKKGEKKVGAFREYLLYFCK